MPSNKVNCLYLKAHGASVWVLCKSAHREKCLHRQYGAEPYITIINIMGKTYNTPYTVDVQGQRQQKEKGWFLQQYILFKINLPSLMHIRTNLCGGKGQAFCCLQGVFWDDGAPIIPDLRGAGGIWNSYWCPAYKKQKQQLPLVSGEGKNELYTLKWNQSSTVLKGHFLIKASKKTEERNEPGRAAMLVCKGIMSNWSKVTSTHTTHASIVWI